MSNRLELIQHVFALLVLVFLALTVYTDLTIVFVMAGISLFISFMIGMYLGLQKIEEHFKNDQNTSGNSTDDTSQST